MPEEKSVKDQLLDLGMTEADFDSHESDLYIRMTEVSMEWLKTYVHRANVYPFVSQIDNTSWLDIPFANADFWIKKQSGDPAKRELDIIAKQKKEFIESGKPDVSTTEEEENS